MLTEIKLKSQKKSSFQRQTSNIMVIQWILIVILSCCVQSSRSLNFDRLLFTAGKYLAVAGMGAAITTIVSSPVFENADSIPMKFIKERKEITGTIVHVHDGDTYRIRHMPNFLSSSKYEGSLKDCTISVRIAAVDTPEIGRGKKVAQRYSLEAKQFAEEKLLGKKVTVKCLAKDRYGRLLGIVKYRESFSTRDISEELLKRGLAVVYRQGGAQYDGGITKWNDIENEAKSSKKGLWSDDDVELPSAYKKRQRALAQ